jgi:excisionase family DNA binding protein
MRPAESIPITPRLLSIEQVSRYIGLSVHTVYRMVSQRRIPFVKMGRLTKFDLRTLDARIEKNPVRPLNHHRTAMPQQPS